MKKKETPKPKKVTSHISEYSSAMEELEDKCASAVAKARGHGGTDGDQKSRAKAIRVKCYDCMGGYHPTLVDACQSYVCPLWGWRKGRGFEDPMPYIHAVEIEEDDFDYGDLEDGDGGSYDSEDEEE